MTNNWKRNLLTIAAAVAVTAVSASAQEITLKADVPFAFSVTRGAILAPGTYIVDHISNAWRFRSETSGEAVATLNYVGIQGKSSEQPSLTFNCVRNRCQVSAIHLGGGAGVELPAPKLSKSDAEELAVVSVPLERRTKVSN